MTDAFSVVAHGAEHWRTHSIMWRSLSGVGRSFADHGDETLPSGSESAEHEEEAIDARHPDKAPLLR